MLEKGTKRAARRHHLVRMKQKAKRVYHFLDPEQAIKNANHLKVCSCYMCGNQRHHWGAPVKEGLDTQYDLES